MTPTLCAKCGRNFTTRGRRSKYCEVCRTSHRRVVEFSPRFEEPPRSGRMVECYHYHTVVRVSDEVDGARAAWVDAVVARLRDRRQI